MERNRRSSTNNIAEIYKNSLMNCQGQSGCKELFQKLMSDLAKMDMIIKQNHHKTRQPLRWGR